jgi:hypothetical protein
MKRKEKKKEKYLFRYILRSLRDMGFANDTISESNY